MNAHDNKIMLMRPPLNASLGSPSLEAHDDCCEHNCKQWKPPSGWHGCEHNNSAHILAA
jgi:hypothetical protein